MKRARHNALRMEHEQQEHLKSCFATLTYTDDFLPYGYEVPTLVKKHLQLFMKKLRRKFERIAAKRKETPPDIRFFGCGEYGDLTGRPHYHVIIFGVDFSEDRIPIADSQSGFPQWQSPTLEKVWGKGRTTICDATFESMSYTAGYVLKKITGKNSGIYKALGIEPEFAAMSLRPAIGKRFIQKYHCDIFPHDYAVTKKGIKISPPRYYVDYLKKNHPLLFENLSVLRAEKNQSRPTDTQQKREARFRIGYAKFLEHMSRVE